MGFPKGKSGNPGGRPKAATALAQYVRDQTRDGVEIADFMIAVLRGERVDPGDPESECWDGKSRRWAAEQLLDRGFGRAPQYIEVATGEGEGAPLPDMRDLPLEELRRIAAGEDAAGEDPPGSVH